MINLFEKQQQQLQQQQNRTQNGFLTWPVLHKLNKLSAIEWGVFFF